MSRFYILILFNYFHDAKYFPGSYKKSVNLRCLDDIDEILDEAFCKYQIFLTVEWENDVKPL